MADEAKNKEKVLKKDVGLLTEFNQSRDPNMLALYYHRRDMAFDCHNAPEYHTELLRYYANDIAVVCVVPRTIMGNHYILVCLQHKQPEFNTLCQLAYQAQRQFCGISLLVKRNCFVCNKPTSLKCTACKCAYFCSKDCQKQGWGGHKELCKKIKASPSFTVEEESVEIELEKN